MNCGCGALSLNLLLCFVLSMSLRQALDGRNKRNFLEIESCVRREPASPTEAEHTNSTLRPHFKAPEIVSARSAFREQINATHPCKFLGHRDRCPFALKCARCVGSHLTIRGRLGLHVFTLGASTKVAFISSVGGCRFHVRR